MATIRNLPRYLADTPVNVLLATLAGVAASPFVPVPFPEITTPARTKTVFVAPNLLTSTLAPAPSPPFIPIDFQIVWPSCRTMAVNPPNLLTGTLLGVTIPFLNSESPTSRIQYRVDSFMATNLLPGLLGSVPSPFVPSPLPEPSQASRAKLVFIGPNLLTGPLGVTLSPPFTPVDLQTVRPAVRSAFSDPPNLSNLLAIPVQVPFFNPGLPVTRIQSRVDSVGPVNLLTSLLSVQTPFIPSDFPQARQTVRVNVQTTPNLLLGNLALPPFLPVDFPSPRRSQRIDTGTITNLLTTALFVQTSVPFAPSNWPVIKTTVRLVQPSTVPNLLTGPLSTLPIFKPWIWSYLIDKEALMYKNEAGQKIIIFAVDVTSGLPKVGDGPNITVYLSRDDGSVLPLGDSTAIEIDAVDAPGSYSFDLAQAETNSAKLRFTGKSSTVGVLIAPITAFTVQR